MYNLIERSKKLRKNDKKGFTLIELIVVIVIIGILAAIVVPRLVGFTTEAEVSACQATQRTCESAIAAYEAKEGSMPADFAALVTGDFLAATPDCSTTGTLSFNSDGVVSCSVAAHARP